MKCNSCEHVQVCAIRDAMKPAYQFSVVEHACPFYCSEALKVHGEWIYQDLNNFRKHSVSCPVCGAEYIGDYDQYCDPIDFNYCPNCGARMDGERE